MMIELYLLFPLVILRAMFLSELDESKLQESEIRELLLKHSKPANKFSTLEMRLKNTERELFDLESEMATETMEWEKTKRLLEESLEDTIRQSSSTGPFGSLWSAWSGPDDSLNSILDSQSHLENDYKHRITLLDRKHHTASQRKKRLQEKVEKAKKSIEFVKSLEKDLDDVIQEQFHLSQLPDVSEDDNEVTREMQDMKFENSELEGSSLQSIINHLVSSEYQDESRSESLDPMDRFLNELKDEAKGFYPPKTPNDKLFVFLVDSLERLESGLRSIKLSYSADIAFLQRMLAHHSEFVSRFDLDVALKDQSLRMMEEVLGRIQEKGSELNVLTTAMYKRQSDLIEELNRLRQS